MLPLTKSTPAGAPSFSPLPPVLVPKVPSLDGLTVRVAPPQDVSAQDIAERLEELLQAYAPRRLRAAGEHIAAGDDVLLDVVAYQNAKLVPFASREGLSVSAAPTPDLPGLGPALVGLTVGQPAKLTLPWSTPDDPMAPATCQLELTVREAWEVTIGNPRDPVVFAQLGLGSTLEGAFAALATQLGAEKVALAKQAMTREVLAEVTKRSAPTVPENLVDLEIGLAWQRAEGDFLARCGLAEKLREEALDAWVRNPALREDTRQRLGTTLVLRAIAVQAQLEVTTRAQALEALAKLSGSLGADTATLTGALESAPGGAQRVMEQLTHLRAIDHVMRVVTFV